MLESLVYSIKKVPARVTAVLAIAIITYFIASIGDILVVSRIHPTTFLYNPSFVVSKTPQFTQAYLPLAKFAGWTTSIPYGASITNAMISMINNTQNIQNPEIGKVYTPQTFEYEIKCNELNMYVFNKTDNSPLLSNGGCSTGYFVPVSDANIDPSTVVLRNVSSGHWSMVAQGNSDSTTFPTTIGSIISAATDEWQCGSMDSEGSLQKRVYGLALYPNTRVAKCVLPNGEIRVLSVSSVQFMGFSDVANNTEITDSEAFATSARLIFTEYDDLLQSMEYSMNHTTFQSNVTIFVEAKLGNSFIDVLYCNVLKSPLPLEAGYKDQMCAYFTIESLQLKAQDVNPLISTARGNRPFTISYNLTTSMTVNHIISPAVQGSQPISMDQIRNYTTEAARYMASLGQNFYADYDESQLYVIFDTMDIVEGFQMPYWLFLTIFICMGVFLVLFGLTEWLMDGLYTSSLYKVISQEVVSQMPSDLKLKAPLLLRSRLSPIRLGGYDIVPRDEQHQMKSRESEVPEQQGQESETSSTTQVQESEAPTTTQVQGSEASPTTQVQESEASSSTQVQESKASSVQVQRSEASSAQIQRSEATSTQVQETQDSSSLLSRISQESRFRNSISLDRFPSLRGQTKLESRGSQSTKRYQKLNP
ncbi:hypothetical protein BGZ46_004529 [Entomortierella lignicola]|nr:hypothetical protein BGZ46_004529 [Entomortierella lignicola]